MTFQDKKTFLDAQYVVCPPMEFYRYLFPEGSFERQGHPEDGKANGLALTITTDKNGNNRGRHTVITDGLEQIAKLLEHPFVITAPIGYWGRSRKAENARWLYALTLDIDYVDIRGLKNLLHLIEVEYVPKPTFLVNSGHGVHLYYVFEQPVAMYRSAQEELRKLKTGLIEKAWNKDTSNRPEAREALGVVQGFRMVGSQSKIGEGYTIEAYETGGRVTLDYLNRFVVDEYRAKDFRYKSRMTLPEAKQKYPEWFERVVVQGGMPGRWYVKRDLYDWWKRQLDTGATIGHRYFCCLCLSVYANKCGISEDELIADLTHYQKRFDALSADGSEPFTIEEAMKTLAAYDDSYVRYPRDTMSRISGIPMKANKRNFQKQRDHLEEARAIRDIRQARKRTTWHNKNGAPTKERVIKEYAESHPEANHTQIAKALGISRPTVIKWLKSPEQEER